MVCCLSIIAFRAQRESQHQPGGFLKAYAYPFDILQFSISEHEVVDEVFRAEIVGPCLEIRISLSMREKFGIWRAALLEYLPLRFSGMNGTDAALKAGKVLVSTPKAQRDFRIDCGAGVQ